MTCVAVPLDGSTRAEAVLDAATAIVSRLGWRVLLFCVADAGGAGFRQMADTESISTAAAAEMYLEQIRGRIGRGLDVETRVSSGNNAALEITRLIEEGEVGLVVIGRHGNSGPGRWLVGSTTDKVVKASTVPVLVVPTEQLPTVAR